MSTNRGKDESNILNSPLQDEECWSLAVCEGLGRVMYQAAMLCAVMPQACPKVHCKPCIAVNFCSEYTTNAVLQPDRKTCSEVKKRVDWKAK